MGSWEYGPVIRPQLKLHKHLFKENGMKSLLLVLGSAVLLFSGCKATMPQETGFLSDYSRLKVRDNATMVYLNNQELGQYSKFIVEPVRTVFYKDGQERKVDMAKVRSLEKTLHDEIVTQLKDNGYQVTSEAGPGVAKIRLALTNIEKGTPALNVLPQTILVGAGLGGASVEGEILDSDTGEQMAAIIASQIGKRFTMAGLSTYGDAQAVMKNWAQRLVQRINEAHGKY